MRLAYLSDQYLPNDATDTLQLANMASAFGNAGLDLVLVSPSSAGKTLTPQILAAHYDIAPSFRVAPFGAYKPAPPFLRGLEKLRFAWRAVRSAKELNADALYTRNLPMVLAGLLLSPLPVFYETYRPWPKQSFFKRFLFHGLKHVPRFAGLVLHSTFAAESYAALGYAPNRILVARNAVDWRHFADAPARDVARACLGLLADDRVLVTYAGTVSLAKGLGLVLDAAARLTQLDFAIVGSTGSGAVEHWAAKLPNVRIVPRVGQAETALWLAASDILIIPPTSQALETIGNTVLPMKVFSYLASGRAIVAGATPDLTEILTQGLNARLVAPDNTQALVEALREMAGDSRQRARLSEGARDFMLVDDWTMRAARIRDFLAERLESYAPNTRAKTMSTALKW